MSRNIIQNNRLNKGKKRKPSKLKSEVVVVVMWWCEAGLKYSGQGRTRTGKRGHREE